MTYILEVQRSSRDPAEILSTINGHGGKLVPVPLNRRLRGVATIAVFSILAAARRAAEALTPVETMIIPTTTRLDLKLDDLFYVSAHGGQTRDDEIIAVIGASGELICIQNGKVSGVFTSRPDAAAAADELKRRGIEAMIFSRAEARLVKAVRKSRVTEGPSPN